MLLLNFNNKVVNDVEEQEVIIFFKSPVCLFERQGKVLAWTQRGEFELEFDFEQVT